MELAYVVALSVALQLAAAIVAITLVPVTNKRLAWGFVALALLLMAVRRALSLYYLVSGDTSAIMDPVQEYIGLMLSVFMLAGISMIRPIFTESRRSAAALAESESRFKAIADYTVDWESWFGADGRYLWVSPSVLEITGYTDTEILAMPDFVSTIVAEEDRAAFRGRFKRAIAGSTGRDFRFRFVRKDGEVRWLSASWQPLSDANGKALGTRTSGRDITEQVLAEEELRATEHMLKAIVETTPTLIYVYDIVEHRNVYANREVAAFLGYTAEQILALGAALFDKILNPEDAETVAQHQARLAEAIDSEVLDVEYRMLHSNGKWRWLRSRDTVFARDSHGAVTRILGSTEDITQRRATEEELRQQASTDELTGTANRRRFFEAAQAELRRAARTREQVAVVFIDMDRLKDINDAHGHAAGDRALIAFADICSRCIREIDLLARVGGDEFALLLPATTGEEACATVERIRTALSETPVEPVDASASLTISAGVASVLGDSEDLDALLSRADRALYLAKEAGRDRTVLDVSG